MINGGKGEWGRREGDKHCACWTSWARLTGQGKTQATIHLLRSVFLSLNCTITDQRSQGSSAGFDPCSISGAKQTLGPVNSTSPDQPDSPWQLGDLVTATSFHLRPQYDIERESLSFSAPGCGSTSNSFFCSLGIMRVGICGSLLRSVCHVVSLLASRALCAESSWTAGAVAMATSCGRNDHVIRCLCLRGDKLLDKSWENTMRKGTKRQRQAVLLPGKYRWNFLSAYQYEPDIWRMLDISKDCERHLYQYNSRYNSHRFQSLYVDPQTPSTVYSKEKLSCSNPNDQKGRLLNWLLMNTEGTQALHTQTQH